MVFWYFGTAFLRESHRAGGEDLRSTDMILHPVALQGKAVSASTCTRPFTYAKRPSRQRLPFKRRFRKVACHRSSARGHFLKIPHLGSLRQLTVPCLQLPS